MTMDRKKENEIEQREDSAMEFTTEDSRQNDFRRATPVRLNRRLILKVLGGSVLGLSTYAHIGMEKVSPKNKKPVLYPKKNSIKAKSRRLSKTFHKRFPKTRQITPGKIPPMSGMLEVADISVVRGSIQHKGKSLSTLAPGKATTIVINVRTFGRGRITVPWLVKIDNKLYKKGVKKISGGNEFTIEVPWKPNVGKHQISVVLDQENINKQAKVDRENSERMVPVSVNEWGRLNENFLKAVSHAVDRWKQQAHFRNITITGAIAHGFDGCLSGPDLRDFIIRAPSARNIPADIRRRLATGVANNFKQWQDHVTVPNLPWYPTFDAYPAPMAPPMPNLIMPLSTCTSSQLSAIYNATEFKSAFKSSFRNMRVSEEVESALESLSFSLALGFIIWLSSAQVTQVMGYGPIPTWHPLFAPIGPVMNGQIIPTPGHLHTAPPIRFNLLPHI